MRVTRRAAFGAVLGFAAGSRALRSEAATRQAAAAPTPRPARPVAPGTLAEFEPLAKRRMTHMAFEYVSAGAGDEITLRENQTAFDRLRLPAQGADGVTKVVQTVCAGARRRSRIPYVMSCMMTLGRDRRLEGWPAGDWVRDSATVAGTKNVKAA